MRFAIPTLSGRRPTPLLLVSVICIIALASALTLWAQRDNADERFAKVKEFRPQNATDPRTNITIRFSSDLVSKDILDQPLPESPVQFDPPLDGVARFVETDLLRFFPDAPLAPATEYTARVSSDRTWADGRTISDNRAFKFSTHPLAVTSVSSYTVAADDAPGKIRIYADIRFNYPVNVEDLRSRTTITGKQNATVGELTFDLLGTTNTQTGNEPQPVDADGRAAVADIISIASSPIDAADVEQIYLITIGAGIDCPNCGQPLKQAYTSDIVIPPRERFVVHSVESQPEGVRGSIAIYFSTFVTVDRADQFITVDPKVDFKIEPQWNTLLLRGDFVPGQTYTVSVERGLPSQAGTALEDDFSGRVTIRDIPPTVLFRSPGIYLPRTGSGLLEIETINLDSISVEIQQVFANNLVYAFAGGHTESSPWRGADMSAVGRRTFIATKTLLGERNQKLSTTVDVRGIISDTARGIYKISARAANQRWVADSRLAMLTDLGISARMSGDYLMVWVNRLSTVEPVRNADIRLYSKNNQVLLSGRTDTRGLAVFEEISSKIEGFEPYLITVESDNDLSYLRFSETQIELADFDVKGRPFMTRGHEAFVYTDRGVYRPGETAHLVALVRNPGGDLPDDFPYFLNVKDPSGRDFQTYRLSTGKTGFSVVDMAIPDYARTGKYTVVARIGEDLEIGRTDIQVEEFVPDRIAVNVSTPKAEYATGEVVPISVKGDFLFGPPAAGQQVTGRVHIENHSFAPDSYTRFNFTDSQRKFATRTENLPEALLDNDGRYTYNFSIPGGLTPPSALKALVGASVSEQGGRAVSGYRELIIHPYPRYLGVRLGFEGYAKPGEPCTVDLIALTPGGQPVSLTGAAARLYRVVYNTILTRDRSGYYRYRSERSETLLDEKKVDITATGATVSFTPPDHGRYRVAIIDPFGGHTTDAAFYASGWGYAPWSMEQPERIEIGLDKDTYRPGDNALVQIRAPFGGKLLVTVEKQTVLETFVVDMTDNTAELPIKIKESFFPNAYITATVIKPADQVDRTSPARAFGIAPVLLSKEGRSLNVKIEAPAVMKPRQTLTVGIDVGAPGISHVTLAAVDAGILQLTGFTTPDPLTWFYGQRAPALRPYDIYSFIYPNITAAESHLSPGGDRYFDAARKRHLNPFAAMRVKPVALWSGLVTTDANGVATVSFDIPAFNGRLVLMAVAAQRDKFGSATREVTVRENIIVQESFPRFVAPNDAVSGLATIFNNSGEPREVTLQLELTGPAQVVGSNVRTVTIPDNSDRSVVIPFKAGLEPGVIGVRLRATSGIDQTEVAFDLPNRPALPLVTKFGSGAITGATAARIATPTDFIPRTTRFLLQTSSLSSAQFKRNLDYLLGYPYGCVEQTTSRVFPLLYFESLARFADPDLLGGNAADYFVQEGVRRLQAMARADGSFTFWPDGDKVNLWTSVYAGHFLLEARRAGYVVDDKVYESVRRRLHSWARGRDLTSDDLPVRAYAAYALASTEQLDRKALNELRQVPVGSLPQYAKFHLAGALALAGDRTAAFAIIDPLDKQPAEFAPETGGHLNSGIRTNAIMLEVLTRLDPENPSAAVLARDLIEDARLGRWYSTQENAFALMALGRYLEGRKPASYTGTVRIDNDSTVQFTEKDFKLVRENFVGRDIELTITGDGPCFYYWQLSGVPATQAAEEFSRGIKVIRQYLDADGNPLLLDSVALGRQVICRLEVTAQQGPLFNVVVNDLIPAGFAIENPRLKTSPRLSWIPAEDATITHADIRDDRVLLFVDLPGERTIRYHYSLRAVSAGEFVVPPVSAECMYNPTIAGASSSGRLVIRRDE